MKENNYEINFERSVLDPHIYIDTKNGEYKKEGLLSLNVKGWLRNTGEKRLIICVLLSDGTIKKFPLNRAREDVKSYLEKKYQIPFSATSGFSFIENVFSIAKIGYVEDGLIRWEYKIKVTPLNDKSLKVIFGPSHIYRIELAIKNRLIPDIKGKYKFVRKGGMPIWSQLVVDELNSESERDVLFIVGDFRFGNKILEEKLYPSLDVTGDYSGIEKRLISKESDTILYRMCMQKILDIIESEKGSVSFLFWDLSIREYENRKKGNHIDNGVYRHPVWNYSESERLVSRNIVDSRDILDDGDKLYIDSSAHPSIMGFAYLSNKINDDGPFDINERQRIYTEALHREFRKNIGYAEIHSIGASAFVKYMIDYSANKSIPLPDSFTFDFSDNIRDATPKEHVVYFLPIRSFKLQDERISYTISQYKNHLKHLRNIHGKVSVVPYDNWACEVTSQKKQYKNWYSPKSEIGTTSAIEGALCDQSQVYRISRTVNPQKLLEINHVLSPNLYGVMDIYMRLISGASQLDVEKSYEAVVHSLFQMVINTED